MTTAHNALSSIRNLDVNNDERTFHDQHYCDEGGTVSRGGIDTVGDKSRFSTLQTPLFNTSSVIPTVGCSLLCNSSFRCGLPGEGAEARPDILSIISYSEL